MTSLNRRTLSRAGGLLAAVAVALTACYAPTEVESAAPETAPAGHVSARLSSQDPEIPVTPASPSLPVQVTDESGNQVEVTDVSRLMGLDLTGSISRVLYSLGLGANIVGRDISTDFPAAAAVPLVTPGGHSFNVEALLELRPTAVITDYTIGERSAYRQLREAGVAVVNVGSDRNLSTVGEFINRVGVAVGLPEAAERLAATTEADIRDATQAAQGRSDGRRMLLLYLRGTTQLVAGRGSGATDLIEALGGVDGAAEMGLNNDFTPITPEAITDSAPDTFIVMTKGLESIGGPDKLRDVPGIAQTPAGANGSVIDVPDSLLLSFGTQTGDLIRAMADALYGPGA